ncbi:MAG: thiamine phosphate synthase [Verrucomicrobia bacterium]|nr:MAG: thiamine phosphate synthase [Verrucomicrobiota bacterium]
MKLSDARLYGILDLGYVAEHDALPVADALLAGGVDVLQLRGKSVSKTILRKVGHELLPLCRAAQVPMIINDFAELALELDADGLHIGQDDGTLDDARKLLGNGKWIGRSTHSLAQARIALTEGFDYIGFGPLFPTPTKLGRPGIGVDHIAQMEVEVGQRIPAFCIGGVRLENLAQVISHGARRVVIVSSLLTAKNVKEATRQAAAMLKANHTDHPNDR